MKTLNPLHKAIGYLLPTTLLLSLAAGCDIAEPLDPEFLPPAAVVEGSKVPADAPMRTAYLTIGSSKKVQELHYAEVEGMAIFEGDVILGTSAQLRGFPGDGVRTLGVSISGTGYRWPNGLVPYTIDENLANTKRVQTAIQHWQDRTNVRFVQRTSANAQLYPNFVTFRTGTDCSSRVGMARGQQFVNLETDCSTGNTIHEIGHTLGLWHEQSREDRNSFVRVLTENIEDGKAYNFNQHITDGDDRGAYDYGSIMHYGATAFSANGKPTLEVLTPGVTIGQRTALSTGDIRTISAMYPNPAVIK